MDRQLARMFDLDRPLLERIHERNLKADFVKAASVMQLDLTKMSAEDINHLYSIHVGLDIHEQQMQAKTAEAIKIGRTLARRMMSKIAQGGPGAALGTVQQYAPHMWDEFEAPRQALKDIAQRSATVTTPQELRALEAEMHQFLPQFSKGGIDPAHIDRFYSQAFPHVPANVRQQIVASFTADQTRIARETGLHPLVAAQQADTLRQMARGPGAAAAAMRGGQVGPRAAAAGAGAMSGWGPAGLMQAVRSGNWGVAAKKALPIAAIGLGVSHLMKKRQEEERERQLAMMQSQPGPTPMAGLRLPMGMPASGGRT